MSFLDALLGNAPQVQLSNQAQVAPQGPQLGFAQAYQQGIGGDAEARQRQLAFLQALQQSAAGQGSGAALAQAQFQGNVNQAQAAAANQLASNRGISPATRAFLMAQNQGQAGAQAAASAAATRAQQQLGAQAQLGGALQGMRGQDLQLAGLGAQGNAAQSSLNSANFNVAQGLNEQMGTAQAGMQQTANQQSLMGLAGGANGLFGAAGRVFGFAHGGIVDSPAEDTEPATLSLGEIVIPRSIAQGPNAPENSRDFVAALQGQAAPPWAFLKALQANAAQVAQRHGQLQRAFADGGQVSTPDNYVELPTSSEPPLPIAPVDIPIAPASFVPPSEIAPAQPTGIDALAAQQILDAQRAAGAQKAAQLAAQQAYAQWAQTGVGPRPDPTGAVPPAAPGLLASHTPPAAAPAATRSVAPTSGGGAPPEPSGREQLLQGFERGAETPEAQAQRGLEQDIEQKGQIQAQGAQAQQEALAQQERQRAQDLATFQQASQANQKAIEQWAMREPDPSRWWANKSLGNKVATGISMILGGFFSGIAGQKNQALQVVEDSIKQDVDAQAQKKGSMLQALQGQGRSLQEAYALTHAAMLESTANRMAQLQASMAQQNVGPDTDMAIQQLRAQASALKQAAAIKAIEAQKVMSEIAKNNAEAAKAYSEAGKARSEALPGPSYGQPIGSEELAALPREAQGKFAHVGGGKWMRAPSEEQAKEAGKEFQSARGLAEKIGNIESLMKKGTLIPGTKDYADAKASAVTIMGMMREPMGFKTLTEGDQKILKEVIPDPSELLTMKSTNLGRLRNLKRIANQTYADAYSKLGVTIPTTKEPEPKKKARD